MQYITKTPKAIIQDHFGKVADPRSKRNQKYLFTSLITIIATAGIAGMNTYTSITNYADSEHIAIDGKTIRNSGNDPLQIVSAWCEQNELVLAQQKVGKGSNEIKAIPMLVDLLELTGEAITIGCYRMPA